MEIARLPKKIAFRGGFWEAKCHTRGRVRPMRSLGLVINLFCILIPPVIAAQLKVDVALVNVVATITDETGRYVPDLTQDDLIVYEDGQIQKISHFSQANDLPVSIGLLLDTSGSIDRKSVV